MKEEIIGYMSNIIDSTDSIIADIIEDNAGIASIESIIENSINISSFASTDDGGESEAVYAVTGCIPEVWGVIFHSHFRTMEEQLDQIINNTSRNGYSTLSTISDVVNILAIPLVLRDNTGTGGTGGGFRGFINWFNDPKNIPFVVGGMAGIGASSQIVAPEQYVAGSSDPSEDTLEAFQPVKEVLGSEVVEFEEPEQHVAGEYDSIKEALLASQSVEYGNGESTSILRGPEGSGIGILDSIIDSVSPLFEHLKDSVSTIGQVGGDFLNNELGIGETIARIAGELLEIWTIINLIIDILAAIVAVGVYAYFVIKDSSIVTNFAQSIQGFMQSMQNFIPSMQSAMSTVLTSSNTIPGSGDIATAPYFVSADMSLNDQQTLRDDNSRQQYSEVSASKSKGDVIYQIINNNDMHTTIEKDGDGEKWYNRMLDDLYTYKSAKGITTDMKAT